MTNWRFVMKKKVLSIMMASGMAFTLAACGSFGSSAASARLQRRVALALKRHLKVSPMTINGSERGGFLSGKRRIYE